MPLFQNTSLKGYNTFNIDVKSLYSFFVFSEIEILEFIKKPFFKSHKHFILGGGSNVLFLNDFTGIVIHMQTKGIEIIKETSQFVFIKVQAGEIWDDLVDFCVNHNYGGIENLSLIPGRVGASPVQNIGAYGVELKDVLFETEFLLIDSGKKMVLDNNSCQFGYRDSIFKNELTENALILNLTLKLSKIHQLKIEYGTIKDELKHISHPNIKDVRRAVIKIRKEKLPDPLILPNAGSFFKNPIIDIEQFKQLLKLYPMLISYPFDNNKLKLAAGQLIDICGWKGVTEKNSGVHDKQALVIVNYNNASGREILDFSTKIQESVFQKFGVQIEREVTIIE